jgi:hypothetical protein
VRQQEHRKKGLSVTRDGKNVTESAGNRKSLCYKRCYSGRYLKEMEMAEFIGQQLK